VIPELVLTGIVIPLPLQQKVYREHGTCTYASYTSPWPQEILF